MSMRVVRPGMLTLVQDRGRFGMQHLGVVPCGAMDQVSHDIANALVGNPAASATLEITVRGPVLEFAHAALVALMGADFAATVDAHPMPLGRPVLVGPGACLDCGPARAGARAYLAVAGGVGVPAVLGSRSTYVPAGFGGLDGRALQAGDRIALADDAGELARARAGRLGLAAGGATASVRWRAPDLTSTRDGTIRVHALDGRHADVFDDASRAAFFGEPWQVLPDSNRMGYRLAGPPLARRVQGDILSEATCLGTVQVPADGRPIVLMADHQTTGGYAKIAEVAGADVARLAQAMPGSVVRFVRIDLAGADALRGERARRLAALKRTLAWHYR
ncbi:MAG: biotin-dependent carboxyltransferase family protein [Burkholderiales bacterium]|nr:biotin-dependent carboxyltransferase family protein [Burkholderiales bacterium]